MAVTTVLSDESSTTIVDGDNDNDSLLEPRFCWSAAFAGASVAAAVVLLLLALGSGLGLTLVSPGASAPAFLTLGALYFLVTLVLAFAAGGYITGRVIEPARHGMAEERFRSLAHGSVAWAVAAIAMAALAIAGGLAPGHGAIASGAPTAPQSEILAGDHLNYWVDMLFRPAPGPSQASLDWTQYAQADTGNATDTAPQTPNPSATPSPDFPETSGPFANQPSAPAQTTAPETPSPMPAEPGTSRGSSSTVIAPEDVRIPQTENGSAPPASIGADKAEVARIIAVGMANGAQLSQYDKDRMAALIVQDAGLALSAAQRRVDNAEARIHDDVVSARDAARQTARYASLWIAISLLFGAIASATAAMSARRQAEAVTFGWPRREPR